MFEILLIAGFVVVLLSCRTTSNNDPNNPYADDSRATANETKEADHGVPAPAQQTVSRHTPGGGND